LSQQELDRAVRVGKSVVAQFADTADRVRHMLPTFSSDEVALRALLVDPSPETIAEFLRANAPVAHTLIADEALAHLGECVVLAVREGIPGDLMECGVFRGGASIYMKGVLEALEVRDRTLWLADSFQGLPRPEGIVDAVVHAYLAGVGGFAVDQAEVSRTFEAYGLLDSCVRFLPGWFSDTLPGFSEPLAILRADGDWYESTRCVLDHLYDLVSPGGFVIIDDYSPLFGALRAVDEFRAERGIDSPLLRAHGSVHFWRKH
jgi:hypothetical protein